MPVSQIVSRQLPKQPGLGALSFEPQSSVVSPSLQHSLEVGNNAVGSPGEKICQGCLFSRHPQKWSGFKAFMKLPPPPPVPDLPHSRSLTSLSKCEKVHLWLSSPGCFRVWPQLWNAECLHSILLRANFKE